MPRKFIVLAVAAMLVSACDERVTISPDVPAEVEFLSTEEMSNLDLPFSDAVRVNDILFLSGKIGNKPGTPELAPGGIQGETRQTMENIKAAVERYGSDMDNVVKCTVFLADMAEWGAMNEVYKEFFPNNKPARSAVGASGIALNARVEIECIAVVTD